VWTSQSLASNVCVKADNDGAMQRDGSFLIDRDVLKTFSHASGINEKRTVFEFRRHFSASDVPSPM